MFNIGSKEWPGISKLIEECGEVIQVCGKLMATDGRFNHWDGTNLKIRLEEELGDLMAAIVFVIDYCKLDRIRIDQRCVEKQKLFSKWQKDQNNA